MDIEQIHEKQSQICLELYQKQIFEEELFSSIIYQHIVKKISYKGIITSQSDSVL